MVKTVINKVKELTIKKSPKEALTTRLLCNSNAFAYNRKWQHENDNLITT